MRISQGDKFDMSVNIIYNDKYADHRKYLKGYRRKIIWAL